MKWKESDFNTELNKIRGILVYGPDAGQVDEFFDSAIKKLQIEKDNIFVVSSNELKDKQEAIFAEACSPSMFGGNKMIVITNASDSDAKLISELIEHPSLGAFVFIMAGDLRAGGGLRSYFENENNVAALPCYIDDERTLATLIQKDLFAAGVKKIDPDAMDYMKINLGVDRGITRSFLKKIAIYVDDKKTVSLEDVEKCLPDTGAANIDDFLHSLTAGHIAQTIKALDRLFFNNAEPNMLVRVLNAHFKKLLDAVVTGRMPRLFWKIEKDFNIAVRIWPESEIVGVLVRLNELERQLRTTGMPNEILLRDFALKLSVRAAKLSTRIRRKS
ncbi:MAG: DNA polymerase III subunit delta [Alphaproteobacteria bacterium]|jgi:DNA polymerase-3 subunit delta|nr:DNA polymerase III subunit delta [Alphaproteobacteria bacterium]